MNSMPPCHRSVAFVDRLADEQRAADEADGHGDDDDGGQR